jgi:hypothetical protein
VKYQQYIKISGGLRSGKNTGYGLVSFEKISALVIVGNDLYWAGSEN